MTDLARYFLWLTRTRKRAEKVKNPMRYVLHGPDETLSNVRWISERATLPP